MYGPYMYKKRCWTLQTRTCHSLHRLWAQSCAHPSRRRKTASRAPCCTRSGLGGSRPATVTPTAGRLGRACVRSSGWCASSVSWWPRTGARRRLPRPSTSRSSTRCTSSPARSRCWPQGAPTRPGRRTPAGSTPTTPADRVPRSEGCRTL